MISSGSVGKMVDQLMRLMGLAIVVTIALIILEKSRRKELFKMVYSLAILVFFGAVLGMLSQLFGEIIMIFHLY